MKKITFLLVLFSIYFSPTFASIKVDSVILDEVNINAQKANIYSDLGRVVVMIDKADIERASVKSMDELLNYVAGMDVRQRGVNGVQSDVSIRGGSFDQILVLLNGVNITDPQTGHYNLDIPLDLEDISRIEILQGSAARVLGPNAFSGAINIITGEKTKKRLSSRNTVGSYGYLAQNITGNYFTEKFQTYASIAHKKSDGYRQNTDYDISSAFIQSKYNTEKTGLFELQLGVQQKSYGAESFYSFAYPNQFEHTKTFFSALNWNYKINTWTFSLQSVWKEHHDRFELFRDFEGADAYPWYKSHNYHQTDIADGKFVVSNQWIAGKTSLGINIRNEHIFSNVLGETMKTTKKVPFEKDAFFTKEANRLLSTAYIDHSLVINNWYASAGASVTHTKQFGYQTNGGIEIAYKPTDFSRIYAASNSAVRLPTFTDLYYQSATQISNPDLKPEKSLTFELGTKINPLRWTLSGSTYYRFGRNIIDWVKYPDAVKWESKNLTEVNAFGADLSYEYRFENSFIKSIALSYSFLNLDKKENGYDSKYALDYLKHKAIFTISHTVWSKLSAHWNVGYYDRAGDYTDFVSKQKVIYKPYILINNRLLWKNSRFTVYTDVNNIFNRKYADFGGLVQPGRNFDIGLQLDVL